MATPYTSEMGAIPQQQGGAPPPNYGGSGPMPQNQPQMQQPQQYQAASMGYSQQPQGQYYDQSKGPMSPPPQFQPQMQQQQYAQPQMQPGMQQMGYQNPQYPPPAAGQPVTNVINISNGAPQTAVVPIIHACVNGHTPYTPIPITGILWAVLCFPIGLICLFSEMQTRCSTCGALL